MSIKLKNNRLVLTLLFMLMTCSISAQTIKGTVKDTSGEPVIGASVLEQGTTNGAVTDLDGNFTLKTNGKKSIVVTYIGMKKQVINPNGKSVINIVMEDENTTLNEVVAIGYGSVRRKDLTGSVTTVGSKDLEAVPVANATEALTGKMAGVQVTTTEGSPDATIKVRVRGGGSITQSNDPLYIVDGFPVDNISDIPASEIEDITVLKDASSTAIYGSRGANGVILVTTKSGKDGKVNVSYNAYMSWSKIAKKLDVLDARDYVDWQHELALLKDDISSYTDYFGNYSDADLYDNASTNDWQDITFGRVGTQFNHSLSVNGGSETIKYAFNYSHMNNKAIMQGSSFKRDNLSLKLNTKPSKRTTLDMTVRYSNTDIRGGGANDAESSYDTDKRLKYSVIYTPIPLSNLTSTSGSDDDDLGNLYNPVTSISDNDRKKNRKNLNLSGAFGWEVFKNFKLKTEWGYDYYNLYDQRYWGTTTYYVKNVPSSENQGSPAISLANTVQNKTRNTNTLTYDFSDLFQDKKNHLSAMAGHEYIITKKRVNTDVVHGFPDDYTANIAWNHTSQGTPYQIEDYYSPDDKLLSFFGRANYDFDSKYLLSATFRADASSKFSKDNRWGYFPSAAAAWRVSSEPFMKSTQNWLDDLKLRLSYGTAGNNNIPTGQLSQEFSASTTSWIDGTSSYWAPSKTMSNPDLKWETTITRNLGLDFTLFHNKLSGSIEGYINTTKDLLIQFPVSGTGYDNQYRNMGKTENKGVEFTFNYNAINTKNFGLTVSGNIGFNNTKIKSLGDMDDFGWNTSWASTEIGNDYWIAVGGAVGQMYGYVADGRYEASDFESYDASTKTYKLKDGVVDCSSVIGTVRPGSQKLKDISGDDGKVTTADQTIIGDANPDATGGFALNARFYGFDLSANFNYSIGNDVYNANKIEFTSTGKYQYRNLISTMAEGKRWTNVDADGNLVTDLTQLAALNANTTMWSPYTNKMYFTSWAVEDASFLRLNTLTLGYTLPATLTKRAGISSLRFYVSAYNVFCITGYSGYDPEVSTMTKTNLTPGVDYSAYPRSRQFLIGMNLNF